MIHPTQSYHTTQYTTCIPHYFIPHKDITTLLNKQYVTNNWIKHLSISIAKHNNTTQHTTAYHTIAYRDTAYHTSAYLIQQHHICDPLHITPHQWIQHYCIPYNGRPTPCIPHHRIQWVKKLRTKSPIFVFLLFHSPWPKQSDKYTDISICTLPYQICLLY